MNRFVRLVAGLCSVLTAQRRIALYEVVFLQITFGWDSMIERLKGTMFGVVAVCRILIDHGTQENQIILKMLKTVLTCLPLVNGTTTGAPQLLSVAVNPP